MKNQSILNEKLGKILKVETAALAVMLIVYSVAFLGYGKNKFTIIMAIISLIYMLLILMTFPILKIVIRKILKNQASL